MDVLGTKIVCLFIMFSLTLVMGLLPVRLVWHFRNKAYEDGCRASRRMSTILGLLNCFAGGVFLGTTMLHLLPEVREETAELLTQFNIETDFAVTEFVACIGFFFIMFMEHCIMSLQHHHNDISLEPIESSASCCDEEDIDTVEETASLVNRNRSYGALASPGPDIAVQEASFITPADALGERGKSRGIHFSVFEKSDGECSHDNSHHGHSDHHHHHHHHHNYHETGHHHTHHRPTVVNTGENCVHIIHTSHHEHHHFEPNQLQGLRSFILLLAMSFHTVFEGLSLGLQTSSAGVWNLLIAIMIHKSVIAFTLGFQFTENLKYFSRAILFVVLFAFMSPIGVSIGIVITNTGQSNTLALDTSSCALQAISTGIFLYVTFFEVLNKEVGADHSLYKVLAIIIGFGLMVVLNLFNHE